MTNTDMSLSRESELVFQQLQEVQSSFYDLHLKKSPLVYRKLLEVLEAHFMGIPVSCLHILGNYYQLKFYKPLDYKSLGVKDIKQLVDEMVNKGMALYFKGRESKEKCLISARMVEIRQKVFLKNEVEKLLNRHGGKIEFESFEDLYKDQFEFKDQFKSFDYDFFALTDLDHLCQVLKDILVVEVANPSGAKVIKAVEVANPSGAKVLKPAVMFKIYNLRKRKRNE
ncbi:hypothetical protein CTI12_AA373630 [Artemisia annua]|uniref:Uncharacterized protein n=1 Tax=Artemisia annua TaxID=35608 RepID=A0A2U1MJD0_ARTAN|nr:hypothetical protein CTI12_AA373630 [Artemisia annua]